MSQQQNSSPLFNKRIFWDVNYEVLDYDKKAGFIIERVFDRGDVEDIRTCRRYYGDDKIRGCLQMQNGLLNVKNPFLRYKFGVSQC